MNAGSYVGRIGGLAVAFGVGAAVLSGSGIACAQPAGSDTSAADAGNAGPSTSDKTPTSKQTSKGSGSDDASTSKDDAAAADPDSDATTGTKPRHKTWKDIFGGHKSDATPESDPASDEPETPSSDGSEVPTVPSEGAGTATDGATTPQTGRHRLRLKPNAAPASSSAETKSYTGTANDVAKTPEAKSSTSTVNVSVPKTSTTVSTLSAVSTTGDSATTTSTTVTTDTAETATAHVSTPLANLVKKLVDALSGNSPSAPAAATPFAWLMAAASRRELAGATADATATNPTMVLNGYNVVATGDPLNVGSYYGMFTNLPGFFGVVQGEQEFNLVDPKTDETVGSFHGLVSQNNSISPGKVYTQIIVTQVSDESLTGTGAGDLPPVGSVLASNGTGRYGTVYSSLPTGEFEANGESINVVKYQNVTRFGTFKMFTGYDGGATLTDDVAFNRPLKTSDGYTIVPAEPGSAVWTSVTGYPPLFMAVQGTQVYNVVDSVTNEVKGSFVGLTTVTSDFVGTYTEAVYVSEVISGDVGTVAGTIPPVGSVYNVIYFHSDDLFVIYSSKPSATGDVNATKLVNPKGKVTDLKINFDAADPPQHTTMVVPGEYTIKPVGDQQVVGINGLPPREAILQSYQLVEVYDKDGTYLGTANADRTTQWDVDGNSTEAVLITGIVTDAGGLPPVGSVFNFSYTGTSGFGQAYYALPGQNGAKDKVVYKYVTPFGGIPLFNSYDAAKGLADYDYFIPGDYGVPFEPQTVNVMAFDSVGASAAGLLGSDQVLCVLDDGCAFNAA